MHEKETKGNGNERMVHEDGMEEKRKKTINVHTYGYIWLLFLNGRVTGPVYIIYIAQLTFPHVTGN